MATPTELSYTVRDELGTTATVLAHINYDGTVETADGLVGEWLALGGLLDAVTGGQIIAGRISIPTIPNTAWKAAPIAGSRVEQTALINMGVAETRYKEGLAVPAVRDTLIAAGKLIVASGAIQALTTALLAGFTNGAFANKAGQVLTSAVDALLSFRKHRKQLTRSSMEFPG